jgi:hypothetical protein
MSWDKVAAKDRLTALGSGPLSHFPFGTYILARRTGMVEP